VRSRPPSDRLGRLVCGRELRPVDGSLLQVIAHDLFLLDDRIPRHAFQPIRDALVQLGASDLGDRVVGRVSDQQMPEPERLLARERRVLWVDQFLANERH
jgi:hypothetical protein